MTGVIDVELLDVVSAVDISANSDIELEGHISHCDSLGWGKAGRLYSYLRCSLVAAKKGIVIDGGVFVGECLKVERDSDILASNTASAVWTSAGDDSIFTATVDGKWRLAWGVGLGLGFRRHVDEFRV